LLLLLLLLMMMMNDRPIVTRQESGRAKSNETQHLAGLNILSVFISLANVC